MLLPADAFPALALLALLGASAWIVAARAMPKALAFAVLTLAAGFLQVADFFFFRGTFASELGFTTPDLLEGDWWRPFSYLFVHADAAHLVGNLFILATAGPVLEDRVGHRAWSILYLGGGVATVASHVLMFPETRVLAIGASGAIFAVLGCLSVVAPRARIPVPMLLIVWMPAWVAAVLYTAFNVAYAFAPGTGVAWYAHFAGMAIGIAAGAALVRRDPARRTAEIRRALDPETLRPLATTTRAKGFLDRYAAIGGQTADDHHYAEAWLAKFLGEATCPTCGAKGMTREGGALRCRNGHVVAPASGS